MRLVYSSKENKGRSTVQHLCHDNAYFIAPTTIPDCKSPQDYAESRSKVMACVSDIHIDSYNLIFARGGLVYLRYSASGSHNGEPHNGIEPSGNKAAWHAEAMFEVQDGKIKGWVKEWDKLGIWKQLGWMKGDDKLWDGPSSGFAPAPLTTTEASTATAEPTTAAAAKPTTTSKAAAQPAKTSLATVAKPAPPKTAGASDSVTMCGQCGGIGYTGATTCAAGTCKKKNDYYSQCL